MCFLQPDSRAYPSYDGNEGRRSNDSHTTFRQGDADLKAVFPTTWTELEKCGLIEPSHPKGPVAYRLTGAGWVEGLHLSDRWGAQDFLQKAGTLSRMLKSYIKPENRGQDALVLRPDICQNSGLSEGFIYNAIESHLLRSLFDKTDACWDDVKSRVLIPGSFGLPI